jgi:hypothetical protein
MADSERALALKDFRYIDSNNAQIEAYQITDRTRWQDEDWPQWLVKQRTKDQKNCLYTDASKPNELFIALESGDGWLGYNAYVIHNADGTLSVMGEIEFGQYYSKVVPVPPKDPPPPPADGLTDQEFYDSIDEETREKLSLTDPSTRPAKAKLAPPVAAQVMLADVDAANEASEVAVLREQMERAVELLKPSQAKAGIKALQHLQIGLETATTGGLKWCECDPGQCDDSTQWGCRQKSPLL